MGRFYQEHCVYLGPMLGWFTFSAFLSSYNKLVFGETHLHFPCPLSMTSIHFLLQWIVSWCLTTAYPLYWGGDRVSLMSWRDFLRTGVSCGLVTSADVGLSNLALVRISIVFYTMVKASAPVFVLLFAFLFRIERITITLVMVVMIIAAGEFLTVLGEHKFDTIGFVLCLSSSVLSGLRWTLVQLQLHKLEPPLKTNLATMRVLSPPMFVSMLLIAFIVERPWNALSGIGYFDSLTNTFYWVGIALLGAATAIAMLMCEFYLIMHSSAIILMIGGVIKEMLNIVIGVHYFGNSLNIINIAGCSIVFLGVLAYKATFHLAKVEQEARGEITMNRLVYNRGGTSTTGLPEYDDDDDKEGIWLVTNEEDGKSVHDDDESSIATTATTTAAAAAVTPIISY